jgi:putative oxidoreductase
MRVLKPLSNCALGSNSVTADRRIWLYGAWFSKLSKGPVAFATTLQAIGVPGPDFIAWLNMLVELLGGLAVILGAFVVLVSLPMAAVLLTAMFSVHLLYGFLSIKLITVTAAGAQFGPPGYETDLLYLACLAALVLGDPGPLAIDNLIRKRSEVGDAIEKRTKLTATD